MPHIRMTFHTLEQDIGEMTKFAGFCLYGRHYLTQGIKTHDDSIEHNDKICPAIESFLHSIHHHVYGLSERFLAYPVIL